MPPEDLQNGLSDAEARRRLDAEGYNELPSREGRSIWATAASSARFFSIRDFPQPRVL